MALCLVAQSPVSDFSIKPVACIGESLEITNLSTNAEDYQWDFCLDDIRNFKQSEKILTLSGLSSGTHYKLVEANDLWFAFVTSYQNNKIFRLDFGDDINNIPSVTDLGSFGGLIVEPYSIDVSFHNGEWFGFVSSLLVNHGVVKLWFGNDLTNTPAASNVGNFGFSTNYIDLQIIYQNGDALLALIANGVLQSGDGSLVTVNFGNSFDNVPGGEDVFTAPVLDGGNTLRGFDLIFKNGNWIGFYSASGGSKIIKLDFGSNIQTTPLDNITLTFAGVSSPFEINILQEGSKYFGIVSNLSAQIAFIDFGTLEGETPVEMLAPVLPSLFSAAIVRHNGKTFIQGASLSNEIHHIIFEAPCSSTVPFSSDITPPIFNFTSSGLKEIELITTSGSECSRVSRAVDILSLSSPDIAFSTNGSICGGTPVIFNAENNTGDIVDYSWSYGDATTGSGIASQHGYSPGNYVVRLEVTAINGCKNEASQNLKIYPEPVADFTIPSGLLCTNNQFTFETISPDTFDGNLSYQWIVNNDPVSTERVLEYIFNDTGPQEISLVTSIPGCSDEFSQTTSAVQAGPVVSFMHSGNCEDESFSFHNTITEPIQTYHWDFGNGQTSTDPNPAMAFESFGDYPVSLTVTSESGCENVKTETISVYSKPVVDFVAAGPPNACSGTPTLFENQTTNPDGGEITTWLWNFGEEADGASQGELHGQHIYAAAGAYEVSLTSTTAEGCVGVGQSLVTINPSPSTEFTFGAACDDVPVLFTGPQDPDIADWYWEIGTSYYDDPSPTHTFRSPGDFPLYLEVTASNGCVATLSRDILVPIPLNPAFSYIKNCVGQEAVFTDITSGQDPVVSRSWNFNDGFTYSGSSVTYNFGQAGNREVALSVTAESGCSYETLKQISILPSPVAGFTANPSSGAFPLEVAFSNTSQTATGFLWEFLDGSGFTSTEMSPAYTFSGPGTFDVKLTATSGEQCESTFVASVTTVAPLPDADIDAVILTPNPDGSLKVIVTIHNKGNTIVRDLPVTIDFSGKLSLTQTVGEPIQPGTKYNLVLSTGILHPESNRYLCATISLLNDLTPAGNRMCAEHEGEMVFISAYPNPTNGTLNVEWISETAQTVSISLCDAIGRQVREHQITGVAGLNRQRMDVRGLENGIYLLRIQTDGSPKAQRILVSGNP